MREEKIFKPRGKTLVIIDWANVYGRREGEDLIRFRKRIKR